MRKKLFFTLVAILFTSSITFGQSESEQKQERHGDPSNEMLMAKLAIDFAQYGYDNKSALALIESAKILAKMPLGKLKIEKTNNGNGDTKGDNKQKKIKDDLTPIKLLVDAKLLAKGDNSLLAVIARVEKEQQSKQFATRGRVYGPAVETRRVYSHSRKTDYILFEGRRLAEVAVIGDGDNDLDLYIYDSEGYLVKKDIDNTDECYISFYPRYSESYKIVVKNLGSVYSDYILLTN